MRIAFGILSSNNTAAAIQQIIDAIGPGHTVIIHHDFSKQPDFHVSGDDVHVIEDYVTTGWGGWSLVEATLRLMETAIARGEFDYFQLLSDTCLPVRPVEEFVDYLATVRPDANIDHVSLRDVPAVMMSHGYRAFAAKDTMRHKLLRRLKYWRERRDAEYQEIAGLAVHTERDKNACRAALFDPQQLVLQLAARGRGFSHPFGRDFECHAGSQWFGCSRAVCHGVLEWVREHAEAFAHFKTMYGPDEFFFHSVIVNMRPLNIQKSNHLINTFDAAAGQRGPAFLESGDLDRLISSGKYFARKFPKEPGHPLRIDMIRRCA
ncbi:beta-1,6-N-acetylglucosaminyltransferase [Thiobacillus sedimenti]|uniref:Peptide O-xylosyltransferase n=1 Tax=Thiobacillus sedimenti TaxID=3110231 RepID=A0ABZ1CK64_9PROT|nr:beta-1,6-N-acetylglucosaminyltransferase [Thiobacillus sp. SCUT-2]WRS38328.1 beta-1,6-N-acetylglucosaminyltransferase [Thiobacillus sp. SCUT-2]